MHRRHGDGSRAVLSAHLNDSWAVEAGDDGNDGENHGASERQKIVQPLPPACAGHCRHRHVECEMRPRKIDALHLRGL